MLFKKLYSKIYSKIMPTTFHYYEIYDFSDAVKKSLDPKTLLALQIEKLNYLWSNHNMLESFNLRLCHTDQFMWAFNIVGSVLITNIDNLPEFITNIFHTLTYISLSAFIIIVVHLNYSRLHRYFKLRKLTKDFPEGL